MHSSRPHRHWHRRRTRATLVRPLTCGASASSCSPSSAGEFRSTVPRSMLCARRLFAPPQASRSLGGLAKVRHATRRCSRVWVCCHRVAYMRSHIPLTPPPSHLPPSPLPKFLFCSRKDCRDLLCRMLYADPIARASLDEVLDHPWMEPPSKRPNQNTLSAGVVDVPMHSHAELRWPDKVDRETFNRIAALESRNGDDAWKGLADALGLVSSRLCEARTGSGGGGVDSPGHLLTSASNVGRFARGLREFPDRVWSLLAKVRSCAVLEWFTLTHPGPSWTFDDAAPWKAVDYLDSKQSQYPRPCRWMKCGYHQTKALRKSAERFVNISDKGWESDGAHSPLFT